MTSLRKKRYRKQQFKQIIIIVAAAFVMGIVATLIAKFLDTPHNVYYPHDEERVQKLIE